MKKMYMVAVAAVLCVLFLAGCQGSTTDTTAASSEAASQTAESASSTAEAVSPDPSPSASVTDSPAAQQPKVPVDYDMATEEDSQKSVDEGHSPWRLDPAFVAQVFVGGQMEPGGIEGDYPIPYEDFTVTQNAGGEAVVTVNNEESPDTTVYLKQLVRQDDTGIWTVVGYDPKE